MLQELLQGITKLEVFTYSSYVCEDHKSAIDHPALISALAVVAHNTLKTLSWYIEADDNGPCFGDLRDFPVLRKLDIKMPLNSDAAGNAPHSSSAFCQYLWRFSVYPGTETRYRMM